MNVELIENRWLQDSEQEIPELAVFLLPVYLYFAPRRLRN